MNQYEISASILSADMACLGQEAQAVLDAGADMLHLDVMDNHYVPNLTFGPAIAQSLRNYGIQAPFDVHLMVKPVDELIEAFAKAGANSMAIHPESTEHLDRSLQLINGFDVKAGLAINPATSLDWLQYTIDRLDFVLIMSVNPGFGGQTFIGGMLEKINRVKQFAEHCNESITVAVDGGINVDTIDRAALAGADRFIVGSALFESGDYKTAIQQLRHRLANLDEPASE